MFFISTTRTSLEQQPDDFPRPQMSRLRSSIIKEQEMDSKVSNSLNIFTLFSIVCSTNLINQ